MNKPVKIQTNTGQVLENVYDAEGFRAEKSVDGDISKFIFSGWDIVAETDKDDNIKAREVRGYSLLAKENENGKYYYSHNDHGDVVYLTDGSSAVKNQYEYDVFGNIKAESELVANAFRYAGEQYDAQTSQYYLRARFYNPKIGRFTQEDIYRGAGLNLYVYVSNNPVLYVDPSGYLKQVFELDVDVWNKEKNPAERAKMLNDISQKQNYSQNDLQTFFDATAVYDKDNKLTNVFEIPTNDTEVGTLGNFEKFFNKLSAEQLNTLYKNTTIKKELTNSSRLRHGGGDHEWFMVAYANKAKEWKLDYKHIVGAVNKTLELEFINIADPKNPGSKISGSHTNSRAGNYAHKELENMIKTSSSWEEYKAKLLPWADKHVKLTTEDGIIYGADALTGVLTDDRPKKQNKACN